MNRACGPEAALAPSHTRPPLPLLLRARKPAIVSVPRSVATPRSHLDCRCIAALTLVQFDSNDPYAVIDDAVPIAKVPT